MFFKIQKTKNAILSQNRFFYICSLILLFLSSFNVLFGHGYACATGFLLFTTCFRRKKLKSLNPLWLAFQAWTFVYIEFPIFIFALVGKHINYMQGFSVPAHHLTEIQLFGPILILSLFFLPFLFLSEASQGQNVLKNRVSDRGFNYLLGAFFPILAFQFFRDRYFLSNQLEFMPGFINELIRFCFHDAAIFFWLCLLNYNRLRPNNKKTVINVYTGILISFIFISTLMGSKGAVLSAFFLFFLMPLCYARIFNLPHVIMPEPRTLFIVPGLAIILYFLGYVSRLNLVQISPTTGKIWESLWFAVSNIGSFYSIIESICLRVSMEFYRYLFFANDFLQNGLHPMRFEVLNYLGKNFINQIFPGTVFPDCYYPSSMLLPNLVQQIPLKSGDYFELVLKMNTQPYTLFGFLVFFFGFCAPIVFFIYCWIINRMLSQAPFFLALAALIFFVFSMSLYGLEMVAQRTLMFVVNGLILTSAFAFLKENRFSKPVNRTRKADS